MRSIDQAVFRVNRQLKAFKVQGDDESVTRMREELKALASARKSEQGRYRRPGMDLTFSAPKSVGIAWAHARTKGDLATCTAIEEAQSIAVARTIEMVEKDFAMWRHRTMLNLTEEQKKAGLKAGGMEIEKVKSILAAAFTHFESRSVDGGVPDPSLHTHVALMNAIENMEGDIYSVYIEYIESNKKALGAAYRAVLAKELQSRQMHIRQSPYRADKKMSNFEMAGISDEHITQFSKRTTQIRETMTTGDLSGDSHAVSMKLRDSKAEMSEEAMVEGWSQQFETIGFDQAYDPRKGISDRGKVRTPEQIKQALFETETHFTIVELREMLYEDAQFLDPEAHPDPLAWVDEQIQTFLKDPDLKAVHDPRKPDLKSRGLNAFGDCVYASRKIIEREVAFEKGLLDWVKKTVEPCATRAEIDAFIAADEARKSTEGMPFTYKDFQREAVYRAIENASALSVQLAGAGFGKTTASRMTRDIYDSKGFTVLACAPSNEAAKGLGVELGVKALSCHQMLLNLEKGEIELNDKTVLMIDEAGMVDFDRYEGLLKRAQEAGARVILMGDTKQLNAVGRGDVLRRMQARSELKSCFYMVGDELRDASLISRQKIGWQRTASQLAAFGFAKHVFSAYAGAGHVPILDDDEEVIDQLVKDYFTSTRPVKDKMVLASTNDRVNLLNQRIRDRLKEQGVVSGVAYCPTRSGVEMMAGDRLAVKEKNVITLADGTQRVLNKNATLTIRSVETKARDKKNNRLFDSKIVVEDDQGQTFELSTTSAEHRALLNQLQYSYAMTVHRSQGKTVDEVFFAPSRSITRELFYVATSRHKHQLKMYCTQEDREQIEANASKQDIKDMAYDLFFSRITEDIRTPSTEVLYQASKQSVYAWSANPEEPSAFSLDDVQVLAQRESSDSVLCRHSDGFLVDIPCSLLNKHLSNAAALAPTLDDWMKVNEEAQKDPRFQELVEAFDSKAHLSIQGTTLSFHVTSNYTLDSDAFAGMVKAVKDAGGRWDATENTWRLPLTPRTYEVLEKLAGPTKKKIAKQRLKDWIEGLGYKGECYALDEAYGGGTAQDTFRNEEVRAEVIGEHDNHVVLSLKDHNEFVQLVRIPVSQWPSNVAKTQGHPVAFQCTDKSSTPTIKEDVQATVQAPTVDEEALYQTLINDFAKHCQTVRGDPTHDQHVHFKDIELHLPKGADGKAMTLGRTALSQFMPPVGQRQAGPLFDLSLYYSPTIQEVVFRNIDGFVTLIKQNKSSNHVIPLFRMHDHLNAETKFITQEAEGWTEVGQRVRLVNSPGRVDHIARIVSQGWILEKEPSTLGLVGSVKWDAFEALFRAKISENEGVKRGEKNPEERRQRQEEKTRLHHAIADVHALINKQLQDRGRPLPKSIDFKWFNEVMEGDINGGPPSTLVEEHPDHYRLQGILVGFRPNLNNDGALLFLYNEKHRCLTGVPYSNRQYLAHIAVAGLEWHNTITVNRRVFDATKVVQASFDHGLEATYLDTSLELTYDLKGTPQSRGTTHQFKGKKSVEFNVMHANAKQVFLAHAQELKTYQTQKKQKQPKPQKARGLVVDRKSGLFGTFNDPALELIARHRGSVHLNFGDDDQAAPQAVAYTFNQKIFNPNQIGLLNEAVMKGEEIQPKAVDTTQEKKSRPEDSPFYIKMTPPNPFHRGR